MDDLPENPLDNQRSGNMFLRLSNECPEKGIVIQIHGFELSTNQKGKPEYHWDVTHFTPRPIKKIVTESSPGFCTALSQVSSDLEEIYKKVLHIHWQHESIGGSRSMKVWTIKEVSKDDLKELF